MGKTVVALAADHAGYELKQGLKSFLCEQGYEVLDLGTHGQQSVDYPDYADKMAEALAEGLANTGIAICGTGVGISIAANRHRHVRAALCHDVTSVRLTRAHNDANVLALGARLIGIAVAMDCVSAFLEQPFEGGRHSRRVEKLS